MSSHDVLAKLSCSLRCDVAAAGTVTIAGAASFGISSRTYVFNHRHRKTVPLALSSKRLRQLRSALAAHRAVYVSVTAMVLDAGGNVEASSRTKRLRITA